MVENTEPFQCDPDIRTLCFRMSSFVAGRLKRDDTIVFGAASAGMSFGFIECVY